jgi:uncharacterized membrane protein YhaH (DUF805 family)
MSTNIIKEINEFLNNPKTLKLNLFFNDFHGSHYYKGGSNNVSNYKYPLNITLVKNSNQDTTTFFFKNSPKFDFSITIKNVFLLIDKDPKELNIECFLNNQNEVLGCNKLSITESSISVQAHIKNSKKIIPTDSILYMYFEPILIENSSYNFNATEKKIYHSVKIENSNNLKDMFNFEGRITRSQFVKRILIWTIVFFFITGTIPLIIRLNYGLNHIIFSIYNIILWVIHLWFLWSQGTKRCHDLNKNGWWQFIPLYIFWMIFKKGNPQKNSYGESI